MSRYGKIQHFSHSCEGCCSCRVDMIIYYLERMTTICHSLITLSFVQLSDSSLVLSLVMYTPKPHSWQKCIKPRKEKVHSQSSSHTVSHRLYTVQPCSLHFFLFLFKKKTGALYKELHHWTEPGGSVSFCFAKSEYQTHDVMSYHTKR